MEASGKKLPDLVVCSAVQENQEGAENLVISETELKQVVYAYKCNKSTLQVKGKLNSITLGEKQPANQVISCMLRCRWDRWGQLLAQLSRRSNNGSDFVLLWFGSSHKHYSGLFI